jgi:endoribonuclease Dicer
MNSFDVFVFTEKKLYDTLLHGFIKIEEFDMIVFDECHHADQSHYYNLIMSDFFYYKYEDSATCKRPRILGLTASPIK